MQAISIARILKRNSFSIVILILLGIIAIGSLLPMWIMIINSFASDEVLANHGFQVWPQNFSLKAYMQIFAQPEFLFRSYGVTVFITAVGTVAAVIITTMFSYVISRPGFRARKVLSLYIYITMLFNGGALSYYIWVTRYYQLKNTLAILILPLLISPFYVLLMRTYFSSIPKSFLEAARLDGASEMRTFVSIAVPLSLPSIATVGLFTMLGYWNDMYQALLFIDKQVLYPLQFLLYKLLSNQGIIPQGGNYTGTVSSPIAQRMAMGTLAILPILFSFTFVQKYFIRGITLGGIKGE